MTSLAEDFPKEQARCRELLQLYREIPTGFFGVGIIEQTLREADAAATSGDPVAMLKAYKKMREIE